MAVLRGVLVGPAASYITGQLLRRDGGLAIG